MQHVQISDLHIFDYCSHPRLLLCTFFMLCLLINVNKNDFCKTYECLINRLSSETKASMPKLHMLQKNATTPTNLVSSETVNVRGSE